MTTLNPRRLSDALRAGARGIHPLEAGTGLLTECGSWLHRDDFASRFITVGTSISDGVTLLASIDWEAAVTALHAGELPASGGERRMGDRLQEAKDQGWLGEVAAIETTLAAAAQKLEAMSGLTTRPSIHLGMPDLRPSTGRCTPDS
jgi:hypothetical protein